MSDERLVPEARTELERTTEESAPSNEPSAAAQRLQAQIAMTRQRVASEVDAIAEKIKPENIKRQLVSSLQERAYAALDLARRNPVPVAVAFGAGLLLLIWRSRARHA
ncbi:MAG: DUF3618 domain-containing protein [Myxococcales bacterium]|nr:MAG: DUF3618 domain-containing protein [Myxococcales bacterium]